MPNQKYCTVNSCHQQLDERPYGSCQNCEKTAICSKQDSLHYDTLLYNEGCRDHHSGGYSLCIMCALESFQTANFKNYEAGEERCWCPECKHDFGALKDLPNTESLVESLAKVQEDCSCSVEGCVAVQNHNGYFHDMSYGWCQACEEFSICYRGITDEPEHHNALLYNEGCREHDSGGFSVCQACAKTAYKEKYPESTDDGILCPICSHDYNS